ncbi:Ketohexokinase [Frankliniella fusca]|uniref:Ketohexokinase n=1 Tax=Frankliniella fusca TaxID=407009 RepID=A0AAE1HQX8_9NEOP|nr:Ketohexokinase [Frankliniella fusca]
METGKADCSSENQDRILVVGYSCFDLIFSAPRFPEEDSMSRAVDYHKRRGGNASNSSTVLSQLGAKPEILAVMTDDEYGKFIQDDLKKNGIIFENCPVYAKTETPFTNIILSLSAGTRTILHYRPKDYPDNSVDDFRKLTLSKYKWIHFEGRGIPEVLKMIDVLDGWNSSHIEKKILYSVELERCHDDVKKLISKGNVVFVAKEFAKFLGYTCATSTLQGLAPLVQPGATIIVPWGEQGAVARSGDGEIIRSSAYPPKAVLDTTGAGDTFIAATIFYLSNNKTLFEAIDFGNKIAGAKCGMVGYLGINEVYKDIENS